MLTELRALPVSKSITLGTPDADGVGRAGILDRVGELVDECVAVGEDRGAQGRLGEHAVLEDGDRDLGPADISTPIKRSPTL